MQKTIDKVRQLEAEARALRRAEKAFWNEVDERTDEVLDYLNAVRKSDSYDYYEASQSTEPSIY